MEAAGPKAYDKISALEVNLHQLQTVSLESYKFDTTLNAGIIQKINIHMKESMQQAQNDLNMFFKLQLCTIIDFLYLRCNMQQYFEELKYLRAEVKANLKDAPILEDLADISFMGFMILISKLVMDKKVYGSLLHQQGIPLPIFFKTTNQFVYQPQLCDLILGTKEFQLVLNVGSVGAKSKGKSLFVANIMKKQEEWLSNEFEDSFYLHTQPLLQSTKKDSLRQQIMLMDFNGSISTENPPQVKKMIYKAASLSSVIIIHLMQKEIQEGILKTQSFLDLFGSRKPNVILFLKDGPLNAKSTPVNLRVQQYQKEIPFDLFSSIKAYTLPFQTNSQKTKNLCVSAPLYISQSIQTPSLSGLKLSLKSLNAEDKEKTELFEKIKETVKPLENKNFLKKDEACYLHSLENICQKKLEYKRNKDIDIQQTLLAEIKEEQNKQSSFKQSVFVTQTMKLISDGKLNKQLYTQILIKSKSTVIDPIKLEKKRLHDNLIMQELDKKLRNYDIHLDDIVNQFVGSKCYSSQHSQGAKKAQDYYRRCYEDMQPLNIIDSNTLLFGNNNLQEFFKSVKIQFKDIFVVSIFGGQSSGKSTLLNYIFRSKFETSSGRCTKGVNISFCKIGQTLIVVLDTEGIMSTVARNDDFTLRIPTFVMMASDLIIVTNFGQLQDPFQKLMQNCLTILHNIREGQKEKKANNTHKMLIALMAKTMKNAGQTNVQDEFVTVLNRLMKLEKTDNIKYNDYIHLTPDDVFTFPSISETKRSPHTQIQPINIYSDDYGKATLGMRSRINELIDGKIKGKNKNLNKLHDVYMHLKFQWSLLQESDNLQNYEANSKKKQEQILEDIYKKKIDDINSIIKKNYRQKSRNTYDNVDQDTLLLNLTQNEQVSKKDVKIFIKSEAPSFIEDKIVDQCQRKFQIIYSNFVEKEISLYKQYRATKKDTEKNQNLGKIHLQGNKALQVFSKNLQMGFLPQQPNKSIESFRKQLENIPLKPNIDKDKFTMAYKTMFHEKIILKNRISLGDVTVNQCLEVLQDIKTQQSSINKFLKPLNNSNQAEITNYYLDFRQQLKKSQYGFNIQVKDLIKFYQIEIEIDVVSKFKYLLKEIESRILRLEAKVLQDRLAVLDKQRVKCFFLGKVYQLTLAEILSVQERQISEYNNSLTAAIKNQITYVQQKVQQMEQNLGNDLISTLQAQVSSSFDYQMPKKEHLIKVMQDNLKKNYEQLKVLYSPDKMLKKALSLTLLCPQANAPNSKAYFVDCYKFVKNPKRFIGEILMNEPFYRLGNLVIQKTIQRAIKEEKDKICKIIDDFKSINDKESLQKILRKYGMNGTCNKFAKQYLYSAGQIGTYIKDILSKKLLPVQEQLGKILNNSQITDKLRKISQDKFKNIVTYAVGCESRCPMCGMKCALGSHDSSPHATVVGCHSLVSFGGCSLRRNNQILTVLCQSQVTKKRWRNLSNSYEDCHQMIKSVNCLWNSDFIKFNSMIQYEKMDQNIRQLKRIWANIEFAMIQSKFNELNPTKDKEVEQAKCQDQVANFDLASEVVDPENLNSKIQLRNY